MVCVYHFVPCIADHPVFPVYEKIFMNQLDWIVLVVTLLATITYGLYKSRTSRNLDGYFLSNRSMPWGLVLLSIMGTQASAITFLSAPGQAYTDGMRFVQYYFGLPLAMVVICIFFVPIFSKLKVYTAYEYLENRFDGKTRTLTSFLFLLIKRIINRYQRICTIDHSFFVIGLEYLLDQSLYGWPADHLYNDGRSQSRSLYAAITTDHHLYRYVSRCLYGGKYAAGKCRFY